MLSNILGYLLSGGAIALIIVFQQEIRKFLLMIGTTNVTSRTQFLKQLKFLKSEITLETDSDTLLNACKKMSKTKTGCPARPRPETRLFAACRSPHCNACAHTQDSSTCVHVCASVCVSTRACCHCSARPMCPSELRIKSVRSCMYLCFAPALLVYMPQQHRPLADRPLADSRCSSDLMLACSYFRHIDDTLSIPPVIDRQRNR